MNILVKKYRAWRRNRISWALLRLEDEVSALNELAEFNAGYVSQARLDELTAELLRLEKKLQRFV